MERAFDMTINALPAFTWNWLHMNETALRGIRAEGAEITGEEIPAEVSVSDSPSPVYTEIESGSGRDVDRLAEASQVPTRVFAVGRGAAASDAVRIRLQYEDQGKVYDAAQNKSRIKKEGETYDNPVGRINLFAISLEEDSDLTVVMDYSSEASSRGFAAVQTKIRAADRSRLRLIQVQRLGQDFSLLNDIGAVCGQGARVEVIHIILSGLNTYEGCRIALEGDRSSASVDTGYQVVGDGHLDMNYEIVHTGKKTVCDMRAAGVLRDRAFKLHRGTIDFVRGCAGSEGNEVEDVLLMDDTVSNQTIPIILCAEEDVVGNHGATIGRIDEDLLFYMQARGMDQEDIYEMMARARIDAVISRIPDEKTRVSLIEPEE